MFVGDPDPYKGRTTLDTVRTNARECSALAGSAAQQFQGPGLSDAVAYAVCMVLCEALVDTAGGDHRERGREASSTSSLEGGVVGQSEGPGSVHACDLGGCAATCSMRVG